MLQRQSLSHQVYLARKNRGIMDYFDLFSSEKQSQLLVLELGCSQGPLFQQLARGNHRIIGLDVCRNSLLKAKQCHTKDIINGTINLIIGNMTAPPLQEGIFDIIICSEVLEHLNSLEKGLESISKLLKSNGLALIIMGLSKRLAAMGHTVIIPDRYYSKDDVEEESIPGIRIIRLKTLGLPAWLLVRIDPEGAIGQLLMFLQQFLFTISIGRYIRKSDVDIIHTHNYLVSATLLLFNRKLGSKLIQTSYSPYSERPTIHWLQRKMLFLVGSWVMKRAGRIIILKPLQQYEVIGDPWKITLLTPGVDTDRFNPMVDCHHIKEKYGLNAPLIVLFTGAIVPRKGVEYLVKAAKLIIDKVAYSQVIFVFAGSWVSYNDLRSSDSVEPYAERLLKLVRELNLEANVKLLGTVPAEDLPGLYAACDIFVLPSLNEGYGLVITEAMASGETVIGTKIGVIPERIRDGWNGFLVDPGDENQIAQKLQYLIDHPHERKRMGENGRKLAVENFSWERVAKEYLKVYQEVAGGSSS